MIKSRAIEKCKSILEEKKNNLNSEIISIQESMGSDTKSSAGDKYETGREMMNQEISKLEGQLAIVNQQIAVLSKIKGNHSVKEAGFGALVQTATANYLISISFGKIVIDEFEILMISPSTPIAQGLIGKKKGDFFMWDGKSIQLEDIQ